MHASELRLGKPRTITRALRLAKSVPPKREGGRRRFAPRSSGASPPFRTNLRSREMMSASYGWQANVYLPASSER